MAERDRHIVIILMKAEWSTPLGSVQVRPKGVLPRLLVRDVGAEDDRSRG